MNLILLMFIGHIALLSLVIASLPIIGIAVFFVDLFPKWGKKILLGSIIAAIVVMFLVVSQPYKGQTYAFGFRAQTDPALDAQVKI